MAAHRDDPAGTHLLGRQQSKQANRAVTNDHDRHPGLHVSRIRSEPAGAKHIGDRQQAWDQVVRGHARGWHECSVGQRHAQ
jgi:hypothetical protein